jgi:hypothetical protein
MLSLSWQSAGKQKSMVTGSPSSSCINHKLDFHKKFDECFKHWDLFDRPDRADRFFVLRNWVLAYETSIIITDP